MCLPGFLQIPPTFSDMLDGHPGQSTPASQPKLNQYLISPLPRRQTPENSNAPKRDQHFRASPQPLYPPGQFTTLPFLHRIILFIRRNIASVPDPSGLHLGSLPSRATPPPPKWSKGCHKSSSSCQHTLLFGFLKHLHIM